MKQSYKCKFGFKLFAVLSLILFIAPLGKADGGSEDSRSKHRFGIYVSMLGDPFPSLYGINLGLNLASFARIHAGYGQVSTSIPDLTTGLNATLSATSMGGGLNLFIPNWSFSPTVGVGYTSVAVSKTGNIGSLTVGGISSSANLLGANFGFDWQTHYGLDLGFGYSYIPSLSTGLPYISLGWFF